MERLVYILGGRRGVTLRLRLTIAYSVTSIVAMIGLAAMLIPLVTLSEQEVGIVIKTLAVVLTFDLLGQSWYNERAVSSIMLFLRQRMNGGKPDEAVVREATAEYLALPRRVALVCLMFWWFTVFVMCAMLWIFAGSAWPKLLYVVATTITASLIAFLFQFSLFRRVISPLGSVLVRYGQGLESIRSSFHISARFRLIATFLVLVFSVLSLAGLMTFGQYLKLSSEQAGVTASSALGNMTSELPASDSKLPSFLRERERYHDFELGVWDMDSQRFTGNSSVGVERLLPLLKKASGSFEDTRSLARVSFRRVGSRFLIATVPLSGYLAGSFDIAWVMIGILVFAFAIAAFLFNLVARDILAPFAQLRRFTTDFAEGKMRRVPVIVTEDELGRLNGALRDMTYGLRTMFADLRQALDEVKRVRREIFEQLREVQGRSSQQDQGVDRSFLSFNDLNRALRDISDNVDVVEKAAHESKDASNEMGRYVDDIRAELSELVDTVRGGSRYINSMIENVEQSSMGVARVREDVQMLRDQIVHVQKNFERLSGEMQEILSASGRAVSLAITSTQEAATTADGVTQVKDDAESLLTELQSFREGIVRIGGVVAIISDVTEQTALLAFNAAIIAAQSQDDHAKDFAVVGDEIRDLAERTESGTKDVGSRMRAISEQTDVSLDELRTALGLIQQGQLLTILANDSVNQIHDRGSKYDRDARGIAEGIYYQNHNLLEIVKSVDDELKRIENLSEFTDECGDDAAALKGALDDLLAFIRNLQNTTSEQGEGGRYIFEVVEHIRSGIGRIRRDLHRMTAGTEEVVGMMNDVRFTSRHNAQQSDTMNADLKRLEQLLRNVEGKLQALQLDDQ